MLFVAEEEGRDAGIVVAIPMGLAEIELKVVAIDPDSHNQGIGKRMLATHLGSHIDGCHSRS
jgi:N-acetylglutamate synthase-like GNAT family acetyltransferase